MKTSAKLDLYKEFEKQYVKPTKPIFVNIPAIPYLTTDGSGKPGSEDFQRKIGALFGVAYTIKMARKSAGRDYKVCGLEGLWWFDDANKPVSELPLDEWNWKLMIRVPDFVTAREVRQAVTALAKRGKLPDGVEVRLEKIKEGQCVQMLHVGPYQEETRTVQAMKEFAEANKMRFHGPHHELYISDPNRVASERLRTILRQAVRLA
ncbi:MAG TPA: GyrI-like domain-containing protein [Bryobacteraceae bacterium]|nr:GyrI-like domain-containing protein [Bryobacteraceae bacterium]